MFLKAVVPSIETFPAYQQGAGYNTKSKDPFKITLKSFENSKKHNSRLKQKRNGMECFFRLRTDAAFIRKRERIGGYSSVVEKSR